MEVQLLEVPVDDLRAVFDIATESMDFGSGFLDHEEVGQLRKIALLLGVDPMEGTPHNFRGSYAHDFVPRAKTLKEYPKDPNGVTDYRHPAVVHETVVCDVCDLYESRPVHHGVSVHDPRAAQYEYEPPE